MRPLAVFDLDGTLADVGHRMRHLRRTPKDWDAFFAAVADDPALPTGVALLRQSAVDCDVAYVTGRPERCRADTLAWLRGNALPGGELVMRRDRDRRPARVTKLELLRRLAAGRVVAVVVDDDRLVCDAYAAAGFPVLRVPSTSGRTGRHGPGAARSAASPDLLQQAQEGEGRT